MSEEKFWNHKVRNNLRAAALFLGMLILMLALGYTLLGSTGLLWAGAFGLITLGVSTRVSSQIVMRFQGGRPLRTSEAPQLYRLLQQLSKRAQLPVAPKLYYIPNTALNAFATGSKKDPAIAITHGLLSRMDLRELSGILAHEVSHIRNNDLQLKSMVNLFSRYTRFFSLIGQILLFINLPLFFMGQATVPWLAIALLLFAPALVLLMMQAFSRTREFDADLEAARLTGDPNALADALEKLDYFNQGGWWARLKPTRGVRLPNILSSHPDIQDRVARLRDLAPRFVPRFDWGQWQRQGWLFSRI